MKVFIIFAFVIVSGVVAQKEWSFDIWETKFMKKLDPSRRLFYKANFVANLLNIETHNLGKHSYKKGLNEYSHLPASEFISTRCKTVLPTTLMSLSDTALEEALPPTTMDTPDAELSPTPTVGAALTSPPPNYPFYAYTPANVPPEVDWSGLMQPVQNQGTTGCGACWAFAAMGALEAMMKIRNPNLPANTTLSPQYLIDCDKGTGQLGCEGGWPSNALKFIRSVRSENSAPKTADYTYAAQRMTCNTQAPKQLINITKIFESYINGNESLLQARVTNYGPTIVAMYMTNNMHSYKSGVYTDSACPVFATTCQAVNHAVIVVGFGTDPVYGDYWKVRNSFGTTWGENGYFRIARNKKNMCNIACWATNVY